MRKIKFRGKCIDNGEWVYGYLMQMYSPKRLFIGEWKNLSNEARIKDELFSGYTEVIPETVGQFTGLKDCKCTKEYPEGQEIYEFDKIDHYATTGYIVFEEGMFTCNTSANNQFGSHKQPLCYLDRSYIEVIGNIYESELKGGKK